MPDRTHEFGLFGAQGERGSEAAARVLDSLAGGISSPVSSGRGLSARLRYLTRSKAGYEAMKQAGISVTSRTMKRWLAGTQRPNNANLEKIDRSYWSFRRQNVAKYLLKRLNSRGGTRVEIHPLDQSRVLVPRQRVLEYRKLNIRHWDAIINAWAKGDSRMLDDAWIDQMVELGSQWGKYEYVTSVGFSA
ncbi:transcriptional regulator [Streptomyces alkaliterrae]|uniref:Transcriptional regulator n=1 Tax=Streptomyces alkaliterrae TaxID=2213162 RepID=A0A5P0Z127_9ACTN|nr:transcriptional regulator [Streptomyces alkaliterrae]MBB1262428.1 transcriptional regulator [Streptomyces alkaliterrae]MQS05369.1 transcriptional regulator [Streptomyces alkaliterrae]